MNNETDQSKLVRVLEPEVMDSPDEAATYDCMDHSEVNRRFVDDLLAAGFTGGDTLDLGTGTALIPIELVARVANCRVMAVDLAVSMLDRARYRLEAHSATERIQLAQVDAKALSFDDESFDCVISNSIIHHLPVPQQCLQEASRVCRPTGLLFFRDLMRPERKSELTQLVETYCGTESAHAQQLFADSLHAALSLDEIRELVGELGFPPETVQPSSDRHWTWSARKSNL